METLILCGGTHKKIGRRNKKNNKKKRLYLETAREKPLELGNERSGEEERLWGDGKAQSDSSQKLAAKAIHRKSSEEEEKDILGTTLAECRKSRRDEMAIYPADRRRHRQAEVKKRLSQVEKQARLKRVLSEEGDRRSGLQELRRFSESGETTKASKVSRNRKRRLFLTGRPTANCGSHRKKRLPWLGEDRQIAGSY